MSHRVIDFLVHARSKTPEGARRVYVPILEINVLVSIYGKKKVPSGFRAGSLESSDLQPKLFSGPGGLTDYTDD